MIIYFFMKLFLQFYCPVIDNKITLQTIKQRFNAGGFLYRGNSKCCEFKFTESEVGSKESTRAAGVKRACTRSRTATPSVYSMNFMNYNVVKRKWALALKYNSES